MTKLQHILFGIMCCNKFIVVTHPVGMHEDFLEIMMRALRTRSHSYACFTPTQWAAAGIDTVLLGLCWTGPVRLQGDVAMSTLPLGEMNLTVCADVWLNWLGEDNYRNLCCMVGLSPNYRGSELLSPDLQNLSQNIAPLPP